MPDVVKETKAQRAERLKREKNPWAMLPEIMEYVQRGFDAIPKDDLENRFRWWGLYTQGDGDGVQGKAAPYFMARIRIPNGQVNAVQVREIAEIMDSLSKGFGDITVRQNIQLHWIRAESLPELFERLAKVGLTTQGACGDDTRNVTGCPLAGFDHDEWLDASPLVHGITHLLNGNNEYYNLPRKYKICMTGCRMWCSVPEINDVCMTAAQHPSGQPGFNLRIGGGLSTQPFYAVPIDVYVPWDKALDVAMGVTGMFKDSDCLRESRAHARLKFLFLKYGYTPERFRIELQDRVDFELERAAPEQVPADTFRDHVGVHRQKQPGLHYAGFSILRGRITSDQLRAVADMSDRFGDGQVRNTSTQNIVVTGVPGESLDALKLTADAADLPLDASAWRRGTITCTGMEFCKLSLTETKDFGRWIIEEMERRLPGYDRQMKININGCPNACGQHWIADVGLQGRLVKVDGKQVEGYDVFLGGGLGANGSIARRIEYRAAASQVPDVLERIFLTYESERRNGETFHDYCARHDDDALRARLGGEPVPA